MAFIAQDPNGDIKYGFDWADWGTLQSATYSVLPSGPTVVGLANEGNIANCQITGIVFGKVYSIKCIATLTSGEVVNQSIAVRGVHK